jgi:ABC-type branched-subunit amino acid transport system ATPase component
MLLEVRNLVKRFDGLSVIEDVSFSVPGGQPTALIGPNGAGKTMLFNLITGVYPVSAGRILVGSTDITHVPAVDRVTELRERSRICGSWGISRRWRTSWSGSTTAPRGASRRSCCAGAAAGRLKHARR